MVFLRFSIGLLLAFGTVNWASAGTQSASGLHTLSTWVPFSGPEGAKQKALVAAQVYCAKEGKEFILQSLSGSECALHGGCGKAQISYLCLGPNDPRLPKQASLSSPDMQKLLDADDDARCKSFGAKSGTDAYINCRLKLQEIRSQSAPSQPAAPVTEMRTVCVEVPMFNTMITQCRQVTN